MLATTIRNRGSTLRAGRGQGIKRAFASLRDQERQAAVNFRCVRPRRLRRGSNASSRISAPANFEELNSLASSFKGRTTLTSCMRAKCAEPILVRAHALLSSREHRHCVITGAFLQTPSPTAMSSSSERSFHSAQYHQVSFA